MIFIFGDILVFRSKVYFEFTVAVISDYYACRAADSYFAILLQESEKTQIKGRCSIESTEALSRVSCNLSTVSEHFNKVFSTFKLQGIVAGSEKIKSRTVFP